MLAASAANLASLAPEEHSQVKRLCLQYEQGGDSAKNVAIRDSLADIFKPYILKWRLLPDEVGIHPQNRDQDEICPSAVHLRGKRILASGFSFAAIGTPWAVEDDPATQAIAKHTAGVLKSSPEWAPAGEPVKVGPLNWTHSNQFVRMVMYARPCTDTDIPIIEGNIDKGSIQSDTKQKKLFDYATEGMVFNVLPYWVERLYPSVVKIFQSACNQEQQVQEGSACINLCAHPKTPYKPPPPPFAVQIVLWIVSFVCVLVCNCGLNACRYVGLRFIVFDYRS